MNDLITEMRKCSKHCRVGILRSRVHSNLCWITGNKIHNERVKNESLSIDSNEFKDALNRAKLALEN